MIRSHHFIKSLLGSSILACSSSLHAESIIDSLTLHTNLDYSKEVLSQQRTLGNKVSYLLENYRDDLLQTGKIYLSGHAIYSYYSEHTDTAGKFPILGRFPTQHEDGLSDQQDILDTADLALTYAPTPWVTAFVHGIYTDLEFPSQEESQIREAFVTVGNLDLCPWYLSVGRLTANFGNHSSYNSVPHSVNNHYFRTDTYDAAIELGHIAEQWRVAFTALNGGRQLRVADSPSSAFGSNFTISGRYDFDLNGWDVSLGGGYLYSSIYDTDNANHPGVNSNIETTRERNGLWNVWTEAKQGPVSLMAELTQSERDWPASGGPVQGLTLQAAYDTKLFEKETRFSLVYGKGKQGNPGDEWEDLHQLAAGVETYLTPNFAVSAEYVYNRSFIPLIMLDRVADRDVDTDTLILSGTLFF